MVLPALDPAQGNEARNDLRGKPDLPAVPVLQRGGCGKGHGCVARREALVVAPVRTSLRKRFLQPEGDARCQSDAAPACSAPSQSPCAAGTPKAATTSASRAIEPASFQFLSLALAGWAEAKANRRIAIDGILVARAGFDAKRATDKVSTIALLVAEVPLSPLPAVCVRNFDTLGYK